MLSPDSRTKIDLRNLKTSAGHNKGIKPFFVFVLGVTISFLTMGISNHSKLNNGKNKPEENISTPLVNEDSFTAAIKFTYIEPLFGELATNKCIEHCDTTKGYSSCKDDCSRLQLVNYGRRAYATNKDNSKDVNEIISRCTEIKIKFPVSSSDTQWQINIQKILSNSINYEEQCTTKDLDVLRILNNKLINSSNYLSLNPAITDTKEREADFVKNLSTLFCLYTNINFAKIGARISDQNSDPQGSDYYKDFISGLKPKVNEIKKAVLKQSADLKIKS